MIQFADLHTQYLSQKDEIDDAIKSVIGTSSFIRGEFVERFETEFATAVTAPYCVSCANGTDAIYIALRSLQLDRGDEVITTAHSWISTSEAISQAGCKVVFVDTEDDFYTIDPELVEAKITSRTRAVIAVHLYGQPASIQMLRSLCDRYGLWLIEDCAQAHLATFQGKQVGTFGHVATWSFYPSKNLGAFGDAGAITTSSREIADYAALFARHGGKNDHVMEGINSRMDGLQAAILSVKLRRLREMTELRRLAAHRYREALCQTHDIELPQERPDSFHVYHLFVIRTNERTALQKHLTDAGIPTGIQYPKALPFYRAYDYLEHTSDHFPVAFRHSETILSLPMHPFLTKRHIEKACDTIVSFFAKRR